MAMLGKELKDVVKVIPDNAIVFIGRAPECHIEGITIETSDRYPECRLHLTNGYSITKDSVMDELFKDLKRQHNE